MKNQLNEYREWRGVALLPHLWSKVRVSKRRLIKEGFHQVSVIIIIIIFIIFITNIKRRLIKEGFHQVSVIII